MRMPSTGRSLRGLSPRRMIGQRSTVRVLAIAAMLAMFMPSLTALSPELAGWLPAHGHIYEGGIPVPHTHPWDRHMDEIAPAGIVFAVGASTMGHDHSANEHHDHEHAGAGVVFTWDTTSTVFAVVVPAAISLGALMTWAHLLRRSGPLALNSVLATVPTPPPR